MTHCEIGFTALLIILCTCGIGIVMLSTLHQPKAAKRGRKKKRTHKRIQ